MHTHTMQLYHAQVLLTHNVCLTSVCGLYCAQVLSTSWAVIQLEQTRFNTVAHTQAQIDHVDIKT